MNIKKLKFYYERIKNIGPQEFLYRVKWKLKQETYYRFLSSLERKNLDRELIERIIADFYFPKFNFETLEPKVFINQYQQHFDSNLVITKANNYLNHKIPIFELNLNVGKNINWNKDYRNDKIWPPEFIGNIHHADNEKGFIRYIWELNRFNHLVDLAKAYFLTKEEKYAQEIVNQLESWIIQNPYLMTVNWFSGLELGIRTINWIFALKLIKNSTALSKEKLTTFLNSIYLQTNYLSNNLSKFSSANNHLTGELAGLKLISAILPSLPKAREWHELSSTMLDQVLLDQTFEDGVGKEQSSNYLIFILDLYFVSSLSTINKTKIKENIKQRLAQSGDFLLHLYSKGMPSLGDSDEANLIGLYNERERIESIFCNLYQINNNHNFNFSSEKSFWIDQQVTNNNNNNNSSESLVSISKLFPKGGYFISKNKKVSLIFDCGPLGYLSTAGHGHCDALSFTLSINGLQFFTDPGTYLYHGGKEWRNYFKSTAAHNTINIDNTEQSEIKGNFIYGKKAQVKIKDCHIGNTDSVVASHNGYNNVGIIHQREFIHDKDKREIVIVDTLNVKNKGEHLISLFFNFHPQVKILNEGKNFKLIRNETEVVFDLDDNLIIQQYHGNLNPIRGWYSPSFGVKKACGCIEGIMKIKETTIIRSKIRY